ncbi:arsenate reductase family protein [Bizionia myxarmorum]|uniref:Arsenate reductase n=1 Tax=Bizionia myxarmorum TaxID=291186 RepID=A0A5D0RE87_9FLAO|nr:ArsC/Spx/MgsR family protein [Bizionia myxarmorum]TYB78864.1 hypothetical protein ES674_03565 [Bizionia myxarmorum]
MKKVYFLKTCSTCTRIIKDIKWPAGFEFQDIKQDAITVKQVEEMQALSGSYEALFSKRAKLYKEMDLKNADLKEADFKHYILEHYTFLSRPVILFNDQIFIGNSKATIEKLKAALIQ